MQVFLTLSASRQTYLVLHGPNFWSILIKCLRGYTMSLLTQIGKRFIELETRSIQESYRAEKEAK